MAGLFIQLKHWLSKGGIKPSPAVCELFELRPLFLRQLFVTFFGLSGSLALSAATVTQEKPEFLRAQIMAKNICGVCHLFPQPDLLDRYTWTNHIKPRMRVSMVCPRWKTILHPMRAR